MFEISYSMIDVDYIENDSTNKMCNMFPWNKLYNSDEVMIGISDLPKI